MVTRTASVNNIKINHYVPAAGYAGILDTGPIYQVDFGTPAAAAAASILSAQSIATAGSTTTFLDDLADVPWGRNLTVVASGAATSTVTVTGYSSDGQPMKETMTLNGATPVVGVKAFYKIAQVSFGATAATTINLGWGTKFGLPFYTVKCLSEEQDGVVATIGTLTAGIRTDPQTATTADPRGLYVPNTTPDAAKRLTATFIAMDFVNSSGNGGLYGIKHFFS